MNNDNIASVVSTLYKIKAEFPYLRIGQILAGFHTWCFNNGIDCFYLRDNEYKVKLDEYYELLKSKSMI